MKKDDAALLGYALCPICEGATAAGKRAKVTVTKGGFLHIMCPLPVYGGCGEQSFCRSLVSSEFVAKKMIEWVNPEEKKRWVQKEAGQEKIQKPKAKPKLKSEPELIPPPKPMPEPVPPPKKKSVLDSIWE